MSITAKAQLAVWGGLRKLDYEVTRSLSKRGHKGANEARA